MFSYNTEHLFSYAATLQEPFEIIGPVAEGLRINVYVTGGEVTGPKVQGKLLAVGADWLTIRRDGIGVLDVRTTIETHDGALIYMSYNGFGDFGEDGYDKFMANEPPVITPLRVVSRFQTSHPDYTWLSRLQCINIGEVDLSKPLASYDVYALK